MAVVVLLLVLVAALVLVAVGLPGTWIMLGAALLWGPLTAAEPFGVFPILGLFALALVGELIEFKLSLSYTRKYGGSRRAGWGAVFGGIVGAIIGIPIPVLGSVVGAFAGAFLGALAAELTTGAEARTAARAAKGALLGRVFGTAMKCGIGVVMAAWILGRAWAG